MPDSSSFTVTDRNLARVARYAKVFDDPGFSHGEWNEPKRNGDSFTTGWFEMSPAYQKFIGLLYKTGFVADFDWGSWVPRADFYMARPEAVAKARPSTLIKLLTAHARADRFNEGHLADQYPFCPFALGR